MLVDGDAGLPNDLGRRAGDVVAGRPAHRQAAIANARRVISSVDVGHVGVGGAGGIRIGLDRHDDHNRRIGDVEERR